MAYHKNRHKGRPFLGLGINLSNGLYCDCLLQDNRTALHYAVAGKNKEAVQFLLQRRVRVDQKDKVRGLKAEPHTANITFLKNINFTFCVLCLTARCGTYSFGSLVWQFGDPEIISAGWG